MTVVAWDGKTLSADRQWTSSSDGSFRIEKKLHKMPRGECASFTGTDVDHIKELLAWYANGADKSDFPHQKYREDWGCLVVATPDRGLISFINSYRPTILGFEKHAIGCGQNFALGAMEMGANSRKAVQVACKLSMLCGGGVDTFKLKKDTK